tara:strand:+ start:59 stop:394 length:336 start_codon:yes stop_codon:yes gene_type:complete
MIEFLLMFSVLVNCLFIWYIIRLISRFINFQEMLEDFVVRLEEYEEHISVIYSLETFYGDETLKNLLTHSKNIVEESHNFRNFVLQIEEEPSEEGLDEEGEEIEELDGEEA